MPKRTKKEMKSARWEEFQDACCKYTKCLFVDVDNVTSKQICIMRKQLRAIGAKMIMGKNTHLKAAIADLNNEPSPNMEDYEERKASYKYRPHLNIIKDQLIGNTGLIFTNAELGPIKDILSVTPYVRPELQKVLPPLNSGCGVK